MFWSWLFPARASRASKAHAARPERGVPASLPTVRQKPPEVGLDPRIPGLPLGPESPQHALSAAPAPSQTDAGAAAAVGAAFLLGAEMALHGAAPHDPGQQPAGSTHAGPASHSAGGAHAGGGNGGQGDGGQGDGGGSS